MKELTVREQLGQAMESLFFNWGLFANIVSGWELIEDKNRPTMATNGKQLFYNPEFVSGNTIKENEWVLLHEAGHCFLGHHLRLTDVDREKANEAFDLALNSLIRQHAPTDRLRKMMIAPGYGNYSDMPKDMEAEFYYGKLVPPPQPAPQQSDESDTGEDKETEDGEDQGQGEGEGEDGETGDQSGDQSGDETGEGEDQSDQSGEQSGGGNGEGKGNGKEQNGAQSGGQSGKQSPQSTGEVLPCPECNTPEEKAAAEGEWQQTVAESMALAQMCGSLPGWLKSLGEKLLGQSEIDWTTLLRRFLTKVVPKGMSYQKPNRRTCWRRDIIMPGKRSRGAGDGLIIADVSGSIFSQINQSVLPEIEKILATIPKSSVTLMQVDTEVRDEKKFINYDFPLRMPIEWKGGGGTDLNPGFEKAYKESGKYKWVVCITDFIWGYKHAINPRVPTLWICIGRGQWSPKGADKPAFGEVINTKK